MNKAILIGNLGQDPELKAVGQSHVLNLRLATSEKYKDRSGDLKERTDWHSVSVWGKRAEGLNRILRKGSRLMVEGRIEYRSYEKDGVTRYATTINVREVELLDGKRDGGSGGGGYGSKPKRSDYDDDPGFGDDQLPF